MIINIMLYMVISFIIIYTILYLALTYIEIKEWNHGICPECGSSWRYRYSSRKEGRVYYCKNGHYIKVKYGSDQEW